jgi:hypothetical protein
MAKLATVAQFLEDRVMAIADLIPEICKDEFKAEMKGLP